MRFPKYYIGPMSKNVVDCVIDHSKQNLIGLIPSRRQVDWCGGYVNRWNTEWVREGHINGRNTHNVSATVSIKEDEGELVGDWMWKNREHYNGLSVLPYDGGSYIQAPFEDCTEETYNKMVQSLAKVDLTQINELTDETDLKGELACAGGNCEVK